MQYFSRRTFLQRSASLAAAAGMCEIVPISAARHLEESLTSPHLIFPTAPRDRISVASWPFRAYIESPSNDSRDRSVPGMDLKDFGAHVREKFDIHNIEPLSNHFASTDTAYLHQFREAVEKAGSHIVNLAVDGKDSYYDADPAARKRAVEYGKKWVDVAVSVGSPSMRSHIARAKNAQPDVERAAEGLRQVADYGAAKKVIVNLENDDLVSEDAFFLVKVIEKVNHPYLRGLTDFCNSMLSGDADFNYRAVTAMFRHGYNICHVKNSEVNDEGKVARIDVQRTFGILKASGFRGYCSMEWEGGGSPYDGTRELINATLKYLA
jgi:sugar phosphate isomerase/epimerase